MCLEITGGIHCHLCKMTDMDIHSLLVSFEIGLFTLRSLISLFPRHVDDAPVDPLPIVFHDHLAG